MLNDIIPKYILIYDEINIYLQCLGFGKLDGLVPASLMQHTIFLTVHQTITPDTSDAMHLINLSKMFEYCNLPVPVWASSVSKQWDRGIPKLVESPWLRIHHNNRSNVTIIQNANLPIPNAVLSRQQMHASIIIPIFDITKANQDIMLPHC